MGREVEEEQERKLHLSEKLFKCTYCLTIQQIEQQKKWEEKKRNANRLSEKKETPWSRGECRRLTMWVQIPTSPKMAEKVAKK